MVMYQEHAHIKNSRKGYEFYTTPPNHQGINISNIKCISIFIDGQEIEKGNIWIGKNNVEIPIEHLCIIGHEFWDAKEKVKIIVRNSNGLPYGSYDVKIKLTVLESNAVSPTRYQEVYVSQTKTYEVENFFVDQQHYAE